MSVAGRSRAMATSLPIDYDKRLMLFSGRANPELAAKIADKLGVDLGPVTLKTFTNGEVYCRFDESIRGADVFLIQPTCGNPRPGHHRQRRADGAAGHDRRGRRRSARTASSPSRPGSATAARTRSPRRASRSRARLVARMLEAAGADRVLTMDLHAGQIQGFFHIPVRPHDRAVHAHAVLRRPRAAGPRRRRAGRRPREAQQEVRRPRSAPSWRSSTRSARPSRWPRSATSSATCKGKTAILVDDMIDTAGTLKAAAQTVLDEGAARVYAAATHADLQRQRLREPRRRGLRADRRHRHDPAAPGRAGQHPRPLAAPSC